VAELQVALHVLCGRFFLELVVGIPVTCPLCLH
jgi:hypothetical protein